MLLKITSGLERLMANRDKKVVKSKPHLAFSPFASDWHVPVALVVVLVLCVAVLITMQQETGEGYLQRPASPGPDVRLGLPEDVAGISEQLPEDPIIAPVTVDTLQSPQKGLGPEEGEYPQEKLQARRSWKSLEGKWRGRAVHTPVGPAPYDIEFEWTDRGCLSGTADNGFSHHTWTFCEQEDQLALEFLSDFQGNDQPIYFKEVAGDDDALTFMADTHQFMRVLIDIGESSAWIKIIHHGKLHVRIELNR